MSKKPVLIISSIAVLAVSIFMVLQREDTPVEVKGRSLVTREVVTDSYHLRRFVEDGTEYLEDVKTGTTSPLSKINGDVVPALDLGEGYAVADFSYMYGTSIVDPSSLKIGIEASIPYTYNSTLEESSVYLETLRYDGWEIAGVYRDKGYIDVYLMKGSTYSRIIVLNNSIKIFYKIKGNLPDPHTYIIEGKDG